MADPPPTNIPAPSQQQLDQWQALDDLTDQSNTNLMNISSSGVTMSGILDLVGNAATRAAGGFEKLDQWSEDRPAKFGMLTTAILGAKEAYTSLAGVDTSRLSTFTGQMKEMLDTIQQSPIGSATARVAIDSTLAAMKERGATASQLTAAEKRLTQGITDSAKAFFTSADNVARMQNAMIQLTLQGEGSNALFGEISKTMQGVGDDLENLSNVTDKYLDVLVATQKETGLSQEKVMEYAAQINRMPGGLRSLLESTGVTTDSTNILTDAIKYATGAGRDQKEVFEDMSTAMTSYKVTGEDALRFSARMTQVADSLGAQVTDVHNALKQSADAFKMFVGAGSNAKDMTQGMAKAMESYVSELTSIGVPAQNAIEMSKNYTDQLSKLSIAQKSFLSAQSGGPGGLRGAYQIDAMIKKGDFEGIRRKTEETLKRMTGPIVSLDEAQKSDVAAERYTRQLQLLQQGPLGGQAKTQQEAENLLEAMRTGAKTPVTTAAEDTKTAQQSLEKVIERGHKIEELSHTELRDINAGVSALVIKAGAANLMTARTTMTGAGGALEGGYGGVGGGISPDRQEMLRRRSAAAPTGGSTEGIFRDMGEMIEKLPMAVKNTMQSFGEALKGHSANAIRQSSEAVSRSIAQYRESMKNMPADQRAAAMQQADDAAALVSRAVQQSSSLKPAALPGFSNLDDYSPAGRQVGGAIQPAGRGTGAPGAIGTGTNAIHGAAL